MGAVLRRVPVNLDPHGVLNGILQPVGGARSGKIGDGKIFVLDLPECIRIRTGERGGEAIG